MTIPEQAVEAGTRAVIERANVRASCLGSEICVSAPCPCAEDIARAVLTAALPLLGVQRPDGVAPAVTLETAQDAGKIATALGLLASCVKSGDGWSEHCESAMNEAFDALRRICAAAALPHTGQVVGQDVAWLPEKRNEGHPDEWDRGFNAAIDEINLHRKRVPHTGQPQEGALSEDAVLDALRKCWGNQDVRDALTVTKWKDGIVIQMPSYSLMTFVSLVRALSAAPASPRAEGEGPYLIWSNEHGAWWRPNRCGYTVYLSEAGRYDRTAALEIAASARDGWRLGEAYPEIAIAERDVLDTAALVHPALPKDEPIVAEKQTGAE